MSREGEDRPGQPSETLAEPQDERNRFPGLRVPGEQEPVCHGPESDHLNRRENRGGQRGKRKRRPRPRLEGRGEAGESNDIAPIPCEGGEGREGEHEGHESEEPETPGALFARLRRGHDLHAGGLVRTSVSGVNESAAMAVQPLLRRRIIRTINRRTINGTPTAIPRRATDVNGPVGPAGVARSRTSTTHS